LPPTRRRPSNRPVEHLEDAIALALSLKGRQSDHQAMNGKDRIRAEPESFKLAHEIALHVDNGMVSARKIVGRR
jgi:hypothetical protein